MAGLGRRLERLERDAREKCLPSERWSPPEAYARLRNDARAEIEADEELSMEPLFLIDEAGIVRARSDNRPVRHTGDYFGVYDEQIAREELGYPYREPTPEEAELFEEWKRRVDEKLRCRGGGGR